MSKFVVEDSVTADISKQDGGQAIIITLTPKDGEESGLFVRLQSWDPKKEHSHLQPFLNKRLRVTVETIDEVA